MSRNRASAKKAGTSFERSIADCLSEHIDDRIDRRVKTGSKDKGDIANLRLLDERVDMCVTVHRAVVECKNVAKLALSQWVNEAEQERVNDEALIGLVIHKRRGKADPLDQYVTFTVRDLVALLTYERP